MAIWCGEAGIPFKVSVGVGDCSWKSPKPRTVIWCRLIGKPAASYCGNSPAEEMLSLRAQRPFLPRSRFSEVWT